MKHISKDEILKDGILLGYFNHAAWDAIEERYEDLSYIAQNPLYRDYVKDAKPQLEDILLLTYVHLKNKNYKFIPYSQPRTPTEET